MPLDFLRDSTCASGAIKLAVDLSWLAVEIEARKAVGKNGYRGASFISSSYVLIVTNVQP